MKASNLRNTQNRFDNNIIMETRKAGVFLLTLALLVFFSHASPATAHESDNHATDGLTVDQVDITSEDSVKAFLLHARDHIVEITNFPEFSAFKDRLAIDGGDWRKDTIYLLRMNPEGVLIQHPYYPTANNGTLNNFKDADGVAVMQKLRDGADSNLGEASCVQYNPTEADQTPKWSCSVRFNTQFGGRFPMVMVAGLHHDLKDVSFATLKCPYYVPETSAVDVVDENTLKDFVNEFVEVYLRLRDDQIGVREIVNILNCFRTSPWRSDSVYLFMMFEENRNVLFNGNNPGLENKFLNVVDENGCNVGDDIVGVINGQARQCKDLGLLPENPEGFVEYLWDDPTRTDDDVDISKDCPNGPSTCSPGTSPKLSYVVRIESAGTGDSLIVGSGIYPESDDGGGGCAIAANGESTRSVMFNLLLIASLMLPAVLFRKNRSKGKTVMKNLGKKTFFICAPALLVFLSGASPSIAHETGEHDYSVTASDVTVANKEKMMEFVLHAKAHWEDASNPNENISFEKGLTVDGGDWKNNTIYLMAIDGEGVIFTHSHYPDAQNGAFISYVPSPQGPKKELNPDVEKLVDAATGEAGGCVSYTLNNEERWSCAVKFSHPVWNELILIGGFHHNDLADVVFDDLICPYYVSEVINEPPYFLQGISADKVVDNDTLRKFVKEFTKHFREQVEIAGEDLAGLARVRNCWRTLPWKYDSIYLFIMTEEDKLVFFNGNTPALENGSLNVTDDNGCDIGNEVVRVINGQARQCRDLGLLPENTEGFIEYLWDDPTDDVAPTAEQGRAPGNVPKVSYIERVEFLGENFIIGSGYHPKDSGSNDGCALAAASDTAKGAVFNLLFIVLILFSAALWKNRPDGSG